LTENRGIPNLRSEFPICTPASCEGFHDGALGSEGFIKEKFNAGSADSSPFRGHHGRCRGVDYGRSSAKRSGKEIDA